ALLRRRRRALSPHHRSRYRTLGEQGAQRDDHRADRNAHRWPVEDRVRARPGARARNLQPPRRHRRGARHAGRPRAVQQGPRGAVAVTGAAVSEEHPTFPSAVQALLLIALLMAIEMLVAVAVFDADLL